MIQVPVKIWIWEFIYEAIFLIVQFYDSKRGCDTIKYVISFCMILNLKDNIIYWLILIYNLLNLKIK